MPPPTLNHLEFVKRIAVPLRAGAVYLAGPVEGTQIHLNRVFPL
jgi:hypothetical protein